MIVFLDANVVFSASNALSNIAKFITQLSQQASLCSSDYALAEARHNIHLKRSQWQAGLTAIEARIKPVPSAPLSIELQATANLPQKDQPILAAAIACRADYLVTGDKRDFGHLYGREVGGVRLVSLQGLALALAH